jgi:hypothetical protein
MVSWPLGNWKLVIEIGLLKFAPQAPSVSSTEMEICHQNTKAPNPHQNKKPQVFSHMTSSCGSKKR